MPKTPRARRRRPRTGLSKSPGGNEGLLARILDTPDLERAIPQLSPDVLHRVIQRCGLEECGALVALATPEQLSALVDLDLWRSDRPGLDEHFDADRFGVWLEVLLECGSEVAARTLAAIDADVVAAALAQYVRVFDPATLSPAPSTTGDESVGPALADAQFTCEVGGYMIAARRGDAWDAIVSVLIGLDADHGDYFDRVMHGCRTLSNAGREIDGLDDLLTDADQVMFDRGVEREHRRERQGYVTPAQARAFLQASRTLALDENSAPPVKSPIAVAYFRGIESDEPDTDRQGGEAPAAGAAATPTDTGAAAAIIEVLTDAGVLAQPPRALLGTAQVRLVRIRAQMEFVREHDDTAYASRGQELAYLANVLVAGCSLQARPFTTQEASDAAFAVCNLGLEHWPLRWLANETGGSVADRAAATLPAAFLVDHDLVRVFQVGWTILYEQVCAFAAEQLVNVLRRLRCGDAGIQIAIDDLRRRLAKHLQNGEPWRARDALDAMAMLDLPAWAALLALIDECPTIHAALATPASGLRSVSATALEFISETSQLADVREFMTSLPERLR